MCKCFAGNLGKVIDIILHLMYTALQHEDGRLHTANIIPSCTTKAPTLLSE